MPFETLEIGEYKKKEVYITEYYKGTIISMGQDRNCVSHWLWKSVTIRTAPFPYNISLYLAIVRATLYEQVLWQKCSVIFLI